MRDRAAALAYWVKYYLESPTKANQLLANLENTRENRIRGLITALRDEAELNKGPYQFQMEVPIANTTTDVPLGTQTRARVRILSAAGQPMSNVAVNFYYSSQTNASDSRITQVRTHNLGYATYNFTVDRVGRYRIDAIVVDGMASQVIVHDAPAGNYQHMVRSGTFDTHRWIGQFNFNTPHSPQAATVTSDKLVTGPNVMLSDRIEIWNAAPGVTLTGTATLYGPTAMTRALVAPTTPRRPGPGPSVLCGGPPHPGHPARWR